MKKLKLLILDEPSAGLSPGNVKKVYKNPSQIKEGKEIGILLIEQNIRFADKYSERLLLLQDGNIEKTNYNLKEIEKKFF